MAKSPITIEMQIDSFLEQFKRSASKAMEERSDWTNNSSAVSSSIVKSKSGCFNNEITCDEDERMSCSSLSAVGGGGDALAVRDVAELLHPQYAIITGGRAKDGCPVITFPDRCNFCALTDTEYQKLMLYLTSVPSLQEADLGFHLVIDRRADRWSSVKSVLMKISIFFPGLIHVAYVLRPSGFFQKAISEVSNKLFKEEFRFRVEVCSSVDDLHEFIEKSQLTTDLGGELVYSHHDWIQQRISLEKFSLMTQEISELLDQFMRQIHDTMFPNNVDATQHLLDQQGAEYYQLKESIITAARHGEALLASIRPPGEQKHVDRVGNVSAVERLLVQLEETEKQFDEFWQAHSAKLVQCLKLRRFEQDFRELQSNFDNHLRNISDMTEVGETVIRVDALIKETLAFQQLCGCDIKKADDVISSGRLLLLENNTVPPECVEPKCSELNRVCTSLSEKLLRRLDTLDKCRELMERVEKANKWCARGVELLTSQHIDKCSSSVEIAEVSLKEIEEFVQSAVEFKTSSPKEFRSILQESTTLETKALVSQVVQRIDDVMLMCDKRVTMLKKLSMKQPRPVQQVIPEPAVPLQPSGGAPNYPMRSRGVRRKGNSKAGLPNSRPNSVEASAEYWGSINTGCSSDNETTTMLAPQMSEQSRKAQKIQQEHVIAELLDTERIYVTEVGSILKGYRDEILAENMQALVPASLQGKCDILFGNLCELYTFHKDVFLKDLENCISTTELVALCFVQKRDKFFRLYSYYCQNIPRSEQLRETLGDGNLYLQACQQKLGHKLPLAAYLLKPVQRITKYQLLLKDLLRSSDTETCSKELKEALDCMLIVLKCVNDSMLQIAITGFPMDLTQQGELLLQGSFSVWTDSKKDLRLRLKTQQRHIFLYHNVMLFCKEATKRTHNKTTYHYKQHLKMSEIGLTESVRGDTRKFEVWLQGRQEVHTIMATNMEQKQVWVSEIKRVLLNQLQELKGEKIKEYSLNHKMLRQASSWETNVKSSQSIGARTLSCDGNFCTPIQSVAPQTAPMVLRAERDSDICELTQEITASSSDYSNSEDEESECGQPPSGRFLALADYCAVGHSEVSMREGDTVDLLKIGCAGWWFVKVLATELEGWAPAAYLESLTRKSRCSSRSKDRLNE